MSRTNIDIERLTAHLSSAPLPGWKAQKLACPPGRQPDVAEKLTKAKRAGVMCLLCPNEAREWSIILMQRTVDNTPHSGQLSFPGGAEERGDHGDMLMTALREFREEMGVSISQERVLGPLTPLYIPPSDYLVHPFLAWSEHQPEFVKQDEEVARILCVPLNSLPLARAKWPDQKLANFNVSFKVPGWECGGEVLWGATAMIMSELIAVCDEAEFGLSFAGEQDEME